MRSDSMLGLFPCVLKQKLHRRYGAIGTRAFAAITLLVVCLCAAPARAVDYTWNTGTGSWNVGGNWTGGLPASGTSTGLVFGENGGYTATNNFAAPPFVLNHVTLSGTSTNNLDGSQIRFVGSSATVTQNGSGNVNFNMPIEIGAPTTFTGNGTGEVSLNGTLSGVSSLTKTGTGTLRLGTVTSGVPADNTFYGGVFIGGGTLGFTNDSDTSDTALRGNRVTFTSGSANLKTGANLRLGELSGSAGTINTLGDLLNGHDITLMMNGDATFGGELIMWDRTGTGVTKGTLSLRGRGVQTLTGATQIAPGSFRTEINNDVIIGTGSTLVIGGAARLTAAEVQVTLQGGNLTLDNSVVNDNDRLVNGGASTTVLETVGGGTFTLIGNSAGTTESIGRLQLGSGGDNASARAGAVQIKLVQPTGATSPTILTLASYGRSSDDSPRNVVDFSANDQNGNLITLGQSGNNPRIMFGAGFVVPLFKGTVNTNTPEGLLSRTNSNGTRSDYSIGWATVNNVSDFATYNSTSGIRAIATTNFAGSDNVANYLLTSTANISGSSNFNVNSLTIKPTAAGQSLNITGAGNLITNAYLLAGPFDFSIVNASGGTGKLGAVNRARYFQVQSAVLTVGVDLNGSVDSVSKGGEGTLVLTNPNNVNLTKSTTISRGVLRATPGSSLPGGPIELRGGILEITGASTYTPTLGAGNACIDWHGDQNDFPELPFAAGVSGNDFGSGGFSAFGANVAVTIDNSFNAATNNGNSNLLNWEDPYFVASNSALVFGSTRADHRITLTNELSLTGTGFKYGERQIQVVDNPNSSVDFARLSGVISGSQQRDLLKTGDGILELTGVNTMHGGVIVAEGSLLVNNAAGLGASDGAYVLLGSHSGTACSALLASNTTGSITIARDINIQTGSSGKAILGNTTAPDAVTAGNASYTGSITLGMSGSTANRTTQLTAETGTNVTLSGPLSAVAGYSGVMNFEKIGGGTVTISGSQNHTPGATLNATNGSVILNSNAGSIGALNMNLLADGSMTTATLNATQHLASLSATSGALVTLTAPPAAYTTPGYTPGTTHVTTDSLAIDFAGGATVDLGNGAMIVNYSGPSPLASITAMAANASNLANFSSWDLPGLTSSVAAADYFSTGSLGVGVVDNNDLLNITLGYAYDGITGAQFNATATGEAVSADSILVKLTYYGDSDLNGATDITDYFLFLAGLTDPTNNPANWMNGDYDYSGTVDITDYFYFLAGLSATNTYGDVLSGGGGPVDLAGGGPVAVPEPSSILLLVLGGLGLARRARRSRLVRLDTKESSLSICREAS